jgi:AcrR family transcriptional regulator
MLHSHLDVPREPGAGPSVPTAGRSRDPRERVLDAMIATASYRGYDRTTVERVLQTARVPAALFDEHFADKEDCFLQALDALLARIESRVAEAVESRAPWPERVRAGLGALLSALAEDPDGARVLLVECLSAGPAANERHFALMRRFLPLLEEGRFHCADPDYLPSCISEAMVGGIVSVLHHRALADRTGELPRLCGELAYFALLPYMGHHRALVAAYAKPVTASRG